MTPDPETEMQREDTVPPATAEPCDHLWSYGLRIRECLRCPAVEH